MKQVYIIEEQHPVLLLLFAGWAADEAPFRLYRPQGMDYMVCYDYRTPDFDASLLERYRRVNVVAWSMGVWAAPAALASVPREKLCCVAFNGSCLPIDNCEGIPAETFRGTLGQLTPASLQKFMRRMCRDSRAYRAFLEVTPRREFDEIREELALIEERCLRQEGAGNGKESCSSQSSGPMEGGGHSSWYDYAIIGRGDRIFPPENLVRHFDSMQPGNMITADCAHYDEPMFRFLLQEVWTMSDDDRRKWLEERRREAADGE